MHRLLYIGSCLALLLGALTLGAFTSDNTTLSDVRGQVTIVPSREGRIWVTLVDATEYAGHSVWGTFPSPVGCYGLDRPYFPYPYDGPTWQSLTIGSTNLDEFIQYLTSLEATAEMVSSGSDDWLVYVRNETGQLRESYDLCFHDGVITTIDIGYYNRLQEEYVWQTIADWGPPHAVSYTASFYTRALYWFDRGTALTVSVINNDVPRRMWDGSDTYAYGRIMGKTFFPYIDPDNYQNTYPFNQANLDLNALPPQPTVPIVVNPFDFDAILRTVTPKPQIDSFEENK